MVSSLVTLLIVALVLYIIWYLVGLFVKGVPHQVIGLILGIIFLLYALKALKFLDI